jgi:hypothetical protein
MKGRAPRKSAGPAAGRQRSTVSYSKVLDDVMPHIPSTREAAVGHAQIWRRLDRWSLNAVRLALVELDQRGVVESEIVTVRNGVPMRVYWLRRIDGRHPMPTQGRNHDET